MQDINYVDRDMSKLYPPFAAKVELALASLAQIGVFEGYRSPERQDYLYAQGRTRGGRIITQAPAWHSWHQYGLAVDVAVQPSPAGLPWWSWEFNPDNISQPFLDAGLHWLSPYEKCHFQWDTLASKVSLADAQEFKDDYTRLWEKL